MNGVLRPVLRSIGGLGSSTTSAILEPLWVIRFLGRRLTRLPTWTRPFNWRPRPHRACPTTVECDIYVHHVNSSIRTGSSYHDEDCDPLVVAGVPVPTTVKPAVMVLPALAVIAIPALFPVSPIAGIVTILVIAGRNPIRACERWARPESCMPGKPPANRVIVARDPRVLRTGARRRVRHNRRRRVIWRHDAEWWISASCWRLDLPDH